MLRSRSSQASEGFGDFEVQFAAARAEHLLDLVSHVEDEYRKVTDLSMAGGGIGQPLALKLRLVQAARDLVHVVADPVQRRAHPFQLTRHALIRAQEIFGGQHQAAHGIRTMRDPAPRKGGIEAAKVALGDPHGQHAGAAVVGRDGRTAPAEHVVDGLG